MKANLLKRGIMIAALSSALLAPVEQVLATEGMSLSTAIKEVNNEVNANALTNALAEVKKESSATATIAIKSTEEMQFELLFDGVALANTEDYLLVYTEADENSDWTGKLYNMSEAVVTAQEDEWTLIQSGDVAGYVKSDALLIGRDAIEAAKTVLTEAHPETDIFTLTEEQVFESFSVGETKEQEAARLAAEEAARIAAEKAAEEARLAAEKAAQIKKGKSVISYAKNFIGNPYVYGGSSLTNGTDCSGFVKSVYSHFGVSLPRTSYNMRSVGERVSYSDMQPGDIVCYSGHVALYMGDGRVVHALNERVGITTSNVNYDKILTIRRVL